MSSNGRLTVTWDEFMAERPPTGIPWLWGGDDTPLLIKAGEYTLLGGDTGVGKTLLISNLILASAAGRDDFLGFPLPGRPVTSLILEAEGNRWKFRDRIRQIATSLGLAGSLPIHFHAMNTELAIDGPTLEGMIAETGAEHVFLDTIGRFWVGNENDATEWRAGVTVPLSKIAAAYGCAFSFGDHYNKPNDARSGQHKIRGTPAKIQDCGAAMRLEIGRGGQGSRILHIDRVKNGALPDLPSRGLLVDLKAGTVLYDETQNERAGPTIEPRVKHVGELLAGLAPSGGDVSTASLRLKTESALHLEKSRATDLIGSAVEHKVIERAGRGYYRLPGALTENL